MPMSLRTTRNGTLDCRQRLACRCRRRDDRAIAGQRHLQQQSRIFVVVNDQHVHASEQ